MPKCFKTLEQTFCMSTTTWMCLLMSMFTSHVLSCEKVTTTKQVTEGTSRRNSIRMLKVTWKSMSINFQQVFIGRFFKVWKYLFTWYSGNLKFPWRHKISSTSFQWSLVPSSDVSFCNHFILIWNFGNWTLRWWHY